MYDPASMLELLYNFRPEYARLLELSAAARQIYGENWQQELNRDITALPPDIKRLYLSQLKTALVYDSAVKLWFRAEDVLAGSIPASMDAVGDIESFDKLLPRFGKLGEQLLIRMRLKLGLSPAYPGMEGEPAKAPAPAPKPPKMPVQVIAPREPKPIAAPEPIGPVKIKKTVLARKKKEEALNHLHGDEREEHEVAVVPRQPARAPVVQPPRVPRTPIQSADLDETIFYRLEEFVAESREVMAMLVLDGGYKSVEEYPYYGFIVDATRALAKKAEALGLHDRARFYRAALDYEITPAKPQKPGVVSDPMIMPEEPIIKAKKPVRRVAKVPTTKKVVKKAAKPMVNPIKKTAKKAVKPTVKKAAKKTVATAKKKS